MTMYYCYLCGHAADPVVTHEGTHWKCTGCAQTFFANPKPATEIILIDELGRAAVVVRARDPYKGMLDLPGGFVDAGETLEEGIAREIQEELGLVPEQYSKPVYVESATANYPWGKELTQVVTAAYTARIQSSVQLTANDDVASINFMDLNQLARDDFAWPTQYDRIQQSAQYWEEHSLKV